MKEKINLGKIPPQAKEMETAVLGAILLEKQAFEVVFGILRPNNFYVEVNKIIFQSMVNLAAKNMPVDLMTVVEELSATNMLEKAGGMYGISKLGDNVDGRAIVNVESYAKKVFEKFLARELINVTNKLNALAYDEDDDVFDLIDYAERSIAEIGAKNIEGGMTHISKVTVDAITRIEEWMKNDDTITGIPSGFPSIDKATRGWQPGDLIILAARPSVGKTAFALNIIRNAAKNYKGGATVAVWSLEMKAVYLVLRMLSAESKTMLYKLQTGRLSEQELSDLVMKSSAVLSQMSIFFDESSSVTIESLSRKARQLKRKNNLGLIVIDYLQLMQGEKGSNRQEQISNISRELKKLAQELEVPIIALSQLSREDGDKGVNWENGPPVRSIRESGAIEQDADVIMMLWGPSDAEIANDLSLEGRRKVKIAKQRNGVLITEELDFQNDIQVFQQIGNVFPNTQGNWRPIEE